MRYIENGNFLKHFSHVLLFLFVLGLTSACAGIANRSSSMIEPGDKIGDILVDKGVDGQFTYGFEVACSQMQDQSSYSCNLDLGEAVNVSTGIVDSTGSGNLDQVWAKSGYQVLIDDRPVDLQAFGTIDYSHPQVGVIRFANVVISSEQPAQVTVRDSGVYDNGDPFSSTSTYIIGNP